MSDGHRRPQPTTHEPQSTNHAGRVGRLFVVATPIGNLGDLSPRAREVLGSVAAVLAEDTRRVRKLLNHFAISTPARPLHEHNEAREVPRLVAELSSGVDLALVSDAGTPAVSDPGFRLVRACREQRIPALTVPGPSAVSAALAVSGIPPIPHTFAGFLPSKAAARAGALAALARLPHTLVLFLTPHRLSAELESCAEQLGGDREAALLAEMTKLHERCDWGTLEEIGARLKSVPPRGEFTLVVGPPKPSPPAAAPSPDAARAALADALERGMPLADARREAARQLGISRRELYALLTPPLSR